MDRFGSVRGTGTSGAKPKGRLARGLRPARSLWVWLAILALATPSIGPRAARAQGLSDLLDVAVKEAPSEPTPVDRQSVTTLRATVTSERVAAERTLAAAQPARIAHETAVLEAFDALEALLDQQLEVIGRLERPEPAIPVAPPVPSAEEAPSIFALNELYERDFLERQESARAKEALKESRAALESARAQLQQAEKHRRAAARALADAPVEAVQPAQETVELAGLDSRLAAERVHLRSLELRWAQQRMDAIDVAGEPSRARRIDSMRESLARSDGSAAVDFAELTRRDAELRRIREATARVLSTAELRLEAAANRYAKNADPSAALLVEVEALTARRDAIRQEIDLLDAQTERLGAQRQLWTAWRRLIAQDVSRSESIEIADFAVAEQGRLDEADLRLQGRIADLQTGLDAIEHRMADSVPGSRAATALLEQRAAFERILDRQRSELAMLARERRVADRVRDEIDLQFGHIDPLEELARAVAMGRDLWSYEIAVVDDSPITVGSLILAIVLMSMGLWASRRASSLLGDFAEKRFSLDAGAANALQTLCFYILLVGFGLLALRAVHFPLTAFTVLGGALAIGIGFGSQNVMNNFISGLILMLERPVRAHDLVEIDGNHGTIERIGARSTQIRATDGRYIIVPNSFFLESNVVNWTLSDELIRTRVVVGVIYGSPTRLVEELIQRVVAEEPQILANPAPIVLFSEFGDNSLNFEVHFWIVARSPMASLTVGSRVRFRIDDLFREHNLVIAFPQRDVHLDSVRPIEVRLMDRGEVVRDAGTTEPKGDSD